MIWIVARREFISNVITLRFFIGFVICLVLIVSSTYILIDDYASRLKTYDGSVITHVDGIMIFSNLRLHVCRPPAKLSFLCVGSDRRMGNLVTVEYPRVPVDAVGSGGGNPLMIVFRSMDMIVIIQVILSMLTLLFAYDTISGEKERGTLALVISNPVSRHQILAGKFIGGIMSVFLPLLVGLLSALIVVWFSGKVDLKVADWVRLGLVVLGSFLYISVFFTLGMLISSLASRSATSLVLLLFIWVFLVIIVPNLSPYLAKQIRPIQDRAVVDNQAAALDSEMWDKLNAYSKKLHQEGMFPPTLWTYQNASISSGDLPYAYILRYAPKENIRWYLAGTKYKIPLELQYADKIWTLYREYNQSMDRQLSLARLLSHISPAWVYYNASAVLSGTDVESYLRFMDQARRYRQSLIDYAENNGGLASSLYFTRMTLDDAPTTKEAEEMVKQMGQDRFGEKMMEYTKNVKPFSNIPTFQYESEGLAGSFVRSLPELAILVILNFLLFMIAYVSFMRGRAK